MLKKSKQAKIHNTYYLPDRHTKAYLSHLTHLDRLITDRLGGILPEQTDPSIFRQVLDIGSGTGNWSIDAALLYPTMSLVGIDIDQYIINYARTEAEAAGVAERVEFCKMDALSTLDFPAQSFDLINMRLAGGFLRTWDWSNMLKGVMHITRPEGTVRLVEMEMISQSSSVAIRQISEMLANAFFHAGHFFTQDINGLSSHLEHLLRVQGCKDVQSKIITSVTQGGTEKAQAVFDYMLSGLPAMLPFIQKWNGGDPDEYNRLCRQALTDIHQDSSFYIQANFTIAWGKASGPIPDINPQIL